MRVAGRAEKRLTVGELAEQKIMIFWFGLYILKI